MARVQLPESRLRSRKRRRFFAILGLWLFLILLLAGTLVGVLYLPHWRVATINVAGVEGTEKQAVEQTIRAQLAGRYLKIVPRDNVLIYPQSTVVAELLKKFPTFAHVEVKAKTLRSLAVEVTKRTQKAVWCGESATNQAPCLLLDGRGVAYEPSPDFEGDVYTTYYGALAPGTLPRQYLTENTFNSLAALVVALEDQQQVHIASVAVDEAGDARLSFINGFQVFFVLSNGGGDVFERFGLALQAAPFKDRPVTDFEYLDLRFGDRLYYKLKGE